MTIRTKKTRALKKLGAVREIRKGAARGRGGKGGAAATGAKSGRAEAASLRNAKAGTSDGKPEGKPVEQETEGDVEQDEAGSTALVESGKVVACVRRRHAAHRQLFGRLPVRTCQKRLPVRTCQKRLPYRSTMTARRPPSVAQVLFEAKTLKKTDSHSPFWDAVFTTPPLELDKCRIDLEVACALGRAWPPSRVPRLWTGSAVTVVMALPNAPTWQVRDNDFGSGEHADNFLGEVRLDIAAINDAIAGDGRYQTTLALLPRPGALGQNDRSDAGTLTFWVEDHPTQDAEVCGCCWAPEQ